MPRRPREASGKTNHDSVSVLRGECPALAPRVLGAGFGLLARRLPWASVSREEEGPADCADGTHTSTEQLDSPKPRRPLQDQRTLVEEQQL